MQLDDVIATTSPDLPRMQEAMERSVRWLDRCIAAHKHPDRQSLFCIIQGGLNLELRKKCCEEMTQRETPGVAIGGLSGGEEKNRYCTVYAALAAISSLCRFFGSTEMTWLTFIASVDNCTNWLPQNKPRYVMGVGYPEDLVVSVALGADMFDCVWPTRTAVSIRSSPLGLLNSRYVRRTHDYNADMFIASSQRFGNAITSSGNLNLRNASFASDFSPIEPSCTCTCCRPITDGGLGITRAFIHHVAAKETVGAHL